MRIKFKSTTIYTINDFPKGENTFENYLNYIELYFLQMDTAIKSNFHLLTMFICEKIYEAFTLLQTDILIKKNLKNIKIFLSLHVSTQFNLRFFCNI